MTPGPVRRARRCLRNRGDRLTSSAAVCFGAAMAMFHGVLSSALLSSDISGQPGRAARHGDEDSRTWLDPTMAIAQQSERFIETMFDPCPRLPRPVPHLSFPPRLLKCPVRLVSDNVGAGATFFVEGDPADSGSRVFTDVSGYTGGRPCALERHRLSSEIAD